MTPFSDDQGIDRQEGFVEVKIASTQMSSSWASFFSSSNGDGTLGEGEGDDDADGDNTSCAPAVPLNPQTAPMGAPWFPTSGSRLG
jgi:hypothetical protein